MIEIWYCDTNNFTEADFQSLLSTYALGEQEEVLRFRFIKDRLYRLLGRQIVKEKYGVSSGDFGRLENGKPTLQSGEKFNISHSGNIVAVAFSENEIGFDIEQIAEIEIAGIISQFHPDEMRQLSELEHGKVDLFYQVWTRKEAFLKATGDGIVKGLSAFNCLKDVVYQGAKEWYIQSSNKLDGYAMAVCGESSTDTIKVRKVERVDILKI